MFNNSSRAPLLLMSPLPPPPSLLHTPPHTPTHTYPPSLPPQYTQSRYCHVYREGELEALFEYLPWVELVTSYFDTGNWCAIARKIAEPPPLDQ
jgi:hypothetical protein